ncbi:MAG: 50S ribosomal protein L17 [Candidatus Campbellbacteria bacterium]|nr:50S ribosomal protein L17 [Candidatus Campbellbacteria bacterium]
MKKRIKERKFGRTRDIRNALMRSLARSLILNEKIKTTEAKAKELRPQVEKMITRSKTNTLHSRRILLKALGNDNKTVSKLLSAIGPRYMERNGGYTRITKISSNRTDGAKEAIIEFV